MRERNKKQAAGGKGTEAGIGTKLPFGVRRGRPIAAKHPLPPSSIKDWLYESASPLPPTLLHYPKFSHSKNEKTVNQRVRKIQSDPVYESRFQGRGAGKLAFNPDDKEQIGNRMVQ